MSLSELNKKAKMSRGAQNQNKRKFLESKQGPTEQKYQFDYSSNYRDVEKFSVCRRLLATEVGKAFGEAANIIEHGEHFMFHPPDYPDDDDWNDPDVGPRVRMEYGTEYAAYVKLKTAYDTKCAQVYHLVWSKCTIAMQNAVKEHSDFNIWDRHKDVLNLWLRIVDISMNGTGAAENDSKRINEAKHRFDRVHQRQKESVGEFYYRFNENYDAMVSQGAYLVQPLIPGGLTDEQLKEISELHAEQEELLKSMSFMNKLDKIRYSGLMDDLDNAKQFGRDEYPKTLVDAYSLANRYRKNGVRIDQASRGREERYDAAFAASDTKKASNSKNNQKQQQKEGRDNMKCYHCEEMGHVRSKCPMLAKAIKYFSKTGKTIDQLKEEVKDVLVSFKGLEEFILTERSSRPFNERDLLLDNQASISVFCNKNYVTNIRPADQEISIAGVSKDKLKTTLVADAKGLGTVYFNPEAIANILCFYDINKRFGVKFDQHKFTFVVPQLNKTLNFVPKGKLYICKDAKFLLENNHLRTANLTNGEKLTSNVEPEMMYKESPITLQSIGHPSMDIMNAKEALSTLPISKDDRTMKRSNTDTGFDDSVKFEKRYLHDPECDFSQDCLQNEEMSPTLRVSNGTAITSSLAGDIKSKLKKTNCEGNKKEHQKQPIFDKVDLDESQSISKSDRVKIKEIKSSLNRNVSISDGKIAMDAKKAREISEPMKNVDSEGTNFEDLDLHNRLSDSTKILSSVMYDPSMHSIKVSAMNNEPSGQESSRRYFSASFPRSSKNFKHLFLHKGKSNNKCKDISFEPMMSAVSDNILSGEELKAMEKLNRKHDQGCPKIHSGSDLHAGTSKNSNFECFGQDSYGSSIGTAKHLVEHHPLARDNVPNKFEKFGNDQILDVEFAASDLHPSCSNEQSTLMSKEHMSSAFKIRDICLSTMIPSKVTRSNVKFSPSEIKNDHTYFQEKHSQSGKKLDINARIQKDDSVEDFDKFGDEFPYGNDRTVEKNDCEKRSQFGKISNISPACIMMKDQYDQGVLTISKTPVDSMNDSIMMTSTVSENLLKFTKREVKSAEAAQQLYNMLGKPSMKDYLSMLRHNHIKNCPVTVKDVERAIAIYGKDLGTIKGRTLSYKPNSLHDEIFVRREQDYTSLCIDIMFINGLAFLVSISKGYNLLVVRYLHDRKMSTVELAVTQTIASYSKHDVIIKMIVCDGEGAISALKASIEGMGVQLEQASKNEHVASIERAIRQIKERVRAFIHSLPFQPTKEITIYLVYYIVGMINNIPRSTSVVEMSPKEKLTGKKLDYNSDFQIQFGEYCQANEEDNLKNSMKSRTFPAICLGPVGNIQSSYYFLSLNSWQVVKRRQWIKLPIPNDVIDKINAKAKTQQSKMPISSEPLVPLDEDEESEVAEETNDEQILQWNYEPDYFHEEEELDGQNGNEPDYFHEEEYQSEANEEHSNDQEVAQRPDKKAHGYNLRKTPQREAWNNKFNENIFMMYFNVLATYNIKKAVQEYGDEGTQSMLKEMKQLHDKDVFEPMDYNLLNEKQKSKILRSLMFVKRKRNGTLKSRFLADGSQQVRSLSQIDASSPTVSTEAVFIQSAIDAMEKRHHATVDVEGAYLHSLMDEEVLIRVEPIVADILVEIDPRYDKYRTSNGSIILKCKRALYGCIQSARLFYENISKVLTSFGFVKNDYDQCVFNKVMYGKQCSILIHVDDLKISCEISRGVEDVINHLKKVYGNVNVYKEDIVDYLGMDFDYSKPGLVSISMRGLVEQVLNDIPVSKESRTPASTELFSVNEESKELDKEKKEKFHSTVAKLLYMAKRGRPDILTAVSFLTTRVLKSTEQDWSKLERIVQYLKGTKDLKLNLTADNQITINAFVDASFACHPDGKSHTGEVITLGGGAVISKSSKQKLVTKSSTEAELVGLSDATPTILWVKNFIESQGHKTDSAIIHQDNKSTIVLAEKGRSTTNRTRHINIRYFFIKDRIESKDVKVIYTNTDEMVADFFSKPLQGQLFERFRSIIMNNKQS